DKAIVEVLPGHGSIDLCLLVVILELGEIDDAVLPRVRGLFINFEHDFVGFESHRSSYAPHFLIIKPCRRGQCVCIRSPYKKERRPETTRTPRFEISSTTRPAEWHSWPRESRLRAQEAPGWQGAVPCPVRALHEAGLPSPGVWRRFRPVSAC